MNSKDWRSIAKIYERSKYRWSQITEFKLKGGVSVMKIIIIIKGDL